MKLNKKYYNCLIAAALLVVFLFSLNPTAFAVGSAAAEFLFETGKKYYEQKDYEQALMQLEKALLVDPEHAQALLYLQIIKEELGLLGRETEEPEPFAEAEEYIAYEEEFEFEPEIRFEAEPIAIEPAGELIMPRVTQRAAAGEYTLGIGDVIEVTVWRHDDLNKTVTIRPDGRISLPLIGEVEANGLTPRQLNESIARKQRDYIRNPKVTVIVSGFESKRILVVGEVKSPGIYPLSEPLTALEAVTQAGGHKKGGAVLRNVMVVRRPYSAAPQIISTDLRSSTYTKRQGRDVALQPGDIVYVPKSFFGTVQDVMDFVLPIAYSYFSYEYYIGD